MVYNNSMDKESFLSRQQKEELEYEALCKRCGACCGALDGDPCEDLRKDSDGKFYCSVYTHRIGMHKTLSGKQFACVPIRDLRPNLPFRSCVYYGINK